MATHPVKLGKYEIRRVLGQGAMGIVYEGFDPHIQRRVALKTIRRDQLDRAEAQELLERFRREAQAAGRLTHPNIVAIYEYGEDGDTAFIAMEFIEGRELKDYFDCNERFPISAIARTMTQLLDALDYSHRNGIVHRDIKPANIILLADGSAKVADFGIARIESSTLTQAGSVLGTPSYMSPEQFMGQPVDGRSDLFSAGVVLYQFLTGEKPFTGGLTTIMHKVLKEDPPPPSELNVQVPHEFDELMRKALAKRPAERFQSAHEFAAAIAAAASAPPTDDGTIINIDATVKTIAPGARASEATSTAPRQPDVMAARRPEAASSPASPSWDLEAAVPKTKKFSQAPAIAIVAGIFLVGLGAAAYLALYKDAPSGEPTAPGAVVAAPQVAPAVQLAAVPAPAPVQPASAVSEPGILTISALGLADPGDPRLAQDKGLLNAELRDDARRQLIEKAVALYVDPGSLTKNYGVLKEKLLPRSAEFIHSVIDEQAPQLGKDGLMSITTRAAVRVREVQKSLNQMSREERVDFIRNNGDPKISVAIAVRSSEGDAAGVPQRSSIAENLLKERIQSFGFRIWNDEHASAAAGTGAAKPVAGADFSVQGEAKFRKLSARLAASGLTIEKFVLSSWTVKCLDKSTGEEIYYNTRIPEKTTWNSEDEALRDVGRLIGEEFSKSFFLQHFHYTGKNVRLKFSQLPGPDLAPKLLRELTGMRSVLAVALAQQGGGEATFEAQLSGGLRNPADLVQGGILRPLNLKFGKQCLNVIASAADELTIAFEPGCNDPAVLARVETLPPAALLDAPQTRREAVVKNPETLKKLTI
jgi:serine/threonine-protein kinase